MDIKEIVLNNLGLDEDSKKRFTEHYDNPFVDNIFKDYLDNEYRFRVPLPRELYKQFDRGWATLNNIAPDFVRKYDIVYNDFYENKKHHNKNTFRVIKLINQHFNEDMPLDEYHDFLKRMRCFEESKFIALRNYCRSRDIEISEKGSLNKAVSLFIDRINELRFSRTSNIEIVLSLNYVDWFLSTTSENWRTCLSLESPSFASYWASLPGAIVDKNLSLLYITNGEKKQYMNFTMDKVLSRTWLLLDKNSVLNTVKFYPSELIKVKDLSTFFPLPLKELKPNYISKYRVYPLHFSNGYTNYIYQDKTKPIDIHNDSFKLKGGGKGLQTIYKDKVFEGPIFSFTHGLTVLIQAKKNILSFFKEPVECISCGKLISSSREFRVSSDDGIYCTECPMKNHYDEEDEFSEESCEHGAYDFLYERMNADIKGTSITANELNVDYTNTTSETNENYKI